MYMYSFAEQIVFIGKDFIHNRIDGINTYKMGSLA